jgi:hypothetical protein
MSEAPDSSDRDGQDVAPAWGVRRSGLLAGLALFAIVLWGGYSRHWSWTGINGHTATLWEWLNLLLLPVAFGILPIWLSRREMLTDRHKRAGAGFVTVFALLVLVGYLVPWAWTGFAGNTLWNWLELIALPAAVALTPLLGELRAKWRRGHSLIALGGIGAFAALVLAGYLAKWGWTGFRGNTLWDWLHLLLLPLLIPAVVAPAMTSIATAGLIDARRAAQVRGGAASGGAASGGAVGTSAPAGATDPDRAQSGSRLLHEPDSYA